MEPLSAIVSLIGGAFQWDARRRQADVALQSLQVEREAIQAEVRLGIATLETQQRLAQIEAEIARILAWQQGDVARVEAHYAFARTRALSGALVAIAGVALVAGALYFATRGSA